ncbi:NAD(P)/FAD-dependent oxidoreductase [Novispirillum sp. DQ9]|uniref:NAD(P)/FAD-dependent oxidoreductase n=1 Tax=Novispirillum sp. DQ9 TaxID=3398612 RepID=UPI003C799F08
MPEAISFYAAAAPAAALRPALAGERTADVCVVGGGITGCSAALHLAERGYRVILVEGEHVGFGASGRSGGQLIAGFNRDQTTLARLVGRDDARHLWALSEEALALTRALIARHGIACALTDGHLQLATRRRHLAELRATAEEWTALGRPGIVVWDRDRTRAAIASDRYIGALCDPGGGHLDPLAYTRGLAAAAEAAGAEIFERSPMTAWTAGDPAVVRTSTGTVRAPFVVLAGNAYLWARERRLGRTIMPVGTYLIATEPLGAARAAALIPGNQAASDLNVVLDYFRRSPDHRLLFGGRVNYSRRAPRDLAAAMRKTMLRAFPQLADVAVEHAWGGFVAITLNRLPQFGRLAPNVLFAQGYSGHGLALAGLAGKLAAEAVAGQAGRFDVFTRIPHAAFPGGTALRTPLLVAGMAWHRLRDLL